MIKPLPETLGKLWRMPLGNIWSSLKAHCIGIWMFRSKGGRRAGWWNPPLPGTACWFQHFSTFSIQVIRLHFQFQLNQLAFFNSNPIDWQSRVSQFFAEQSVPYSKNRFQNMEIRRQVCTYHFWQYFANVLENLSCRRTKLELKKNKTEVGLDWRITKSGLKKWQRHMSTFSSNEKLECGRLRVKIEMWQGGGEVMVVTAINVWRETALHI